jgi:hypothetical protein
MFVGEGLIATFIDAHRPETDIYGNTVNARAEFGNDGAGQSVTFYDAFFDKDSLKQNQIMVHEGMHLIFNLGDSDLARAASSIRGRDSNASENFQKQLEKYCQQNNDSDHSSYFIDNRARTK